MATVRVRFMARRMIFDGFGALAFLRFADDGSSLISVERSGASR